VTAAPSCSIVTRGTVESAYLTATVGMPTTPNPGPIGPTIRLTARATIVDGGDLGQGIMSQFLWTPGDMAWLWDLDHNGSMEIATSHDGTNLHGNGIVATAADLAALGAGPVEFGVEMTQPVAGHLLATAIRRVGSDWIPFGTPYSSAGSYPFAAPGSPIGVGWRQDLGAWPYQGRLEWVQYETAGRVVRFDAADYPGTGTSYTDPRGETWTLPAGAITPAVIGPVRFADTAAELIGGEPTALAELAVSWGRGNTFEQPTPATCTFAVLDRRGGTAFAESLRVGDPVEVHAAGDIAQGIPIDVAIDGGFETSPTGPAGNRVAAVAPATATIVAAPTATGARALELRTGTARAVVRIPPAAFTPGNPAGWDSIPRLGPNEWTWTVAVRPAMNARVGAIGIGFADPQTVEPTGIVGAQTQVAWGNASSWTTLSDTVRASTATADDWLGISVDTDLATWTAPYGLAAPYAWTGAPGTWADYAPTYVDDVVLMAPAGGTVRDVLVFAGRISDLAATIDDPSGTVRIDVIAVDQLADLENRYVGDEPWLAEPFADRVERILSLAAVAVPATIDAGLADLIVSWRDVDSQSAGALIAELAAGVDGVLWSATHSTTGPYIWIEDVAGRAQVESLELVNGYVTIVIAGERPAGRTALDGCQIDAAPLTWIRDMSDVITRVDATWAEQTLDDEGLPSPTDRAVRVSDPDLENEFGVRRLGLTTPLVTAADATDVAQRVLFRTRNPQGRLDGLTWDLGLFPPDDGDTMAAALDLLDGTIRIGRGMIVDDVDLWPGTDPIGLYLDGGRYLYDGAWTLGLIGTPLGGMGESATWNELDPAWAWNEWDTGIEWADLYGVAGPLSNGA